MNQAFWHPGVHNTTENITRTNKQSYSTTKPSECPKMSYLQLAAFFIMFLGDFLGFFFLQFFFFCVYQRSLFLKRDIIWPSRRGGIERIWDGLTSRDLY